MACLQMDDRVNERDRDGNVCVCVCAFACHAENFSEEKAKSI